MAIRTATQRIPRGSLVRLVLRDLLVPPDRQVLPDRKVHPVPAVPPDPKALRDSTVLRVHKDLRGHKVFPDPKVLPERSGSRARSGQLVPAVQRDPLDQRDRAVLPAHPVPPVPRVRRVPPDNPVRKGREGCLVGRTCTSRSLATPRRRIPETSADAAAQTRSAPRSFPAAGFAPTGRSIRPVHRESQGEPGSTSAIPKIRGCFTGN